MAALRSLSKFMIGAFRLKMQRVSLIPTHRLLRTSPVTFSGLDTEFSHAKERLNALKDDPGNEAKLKIYALFKQATSGKCSTSRPGMMDFVGRAKWDAWNAVGDISQDDAKKQYIEYIDGIVGALSTSVDATPVSASDPTADVTLTRENKISIIKLNRPLKKNALKFEMYEQISDYFEEIGKDNSSVVVITGSGDYYCSGNDLGNFMNINPADIAQISKDGGKVLGRFVASFIDCPKPLIALVNGPAVGVSVTTLALCDKVIATDKATFQTPFSDLGQTPEGCSSYLFPKIMGPSKASEMLLFNRKLTAHEACDRGLIAEVIPDDKFQEVAWSRVREYSELPPQTMRYAKKIIRGVDLDTLHLTNKQECERLVERWQSDECMNAILNFFQQKSKI